MDSSVLPFQPQRLQSMQPTNRSPQWSISMSGRWQRWQVRPNAAKGEDGCFFAPCEAAQARLTRLVLFLPTRDGFAGSPLTASTKVARAKDRTYCSHNPQSSRTVKSRTTAISVNLAIVFTP
jgi:hypothetical protein